MPTKKTVSKKRVAVKSGGVKKAPVKKSVTIKVKDIDELDIHQPAVVPLIMYRRIALTFIVLVTAALLVVLYLSTVQAVIHVDSAEAPITTEFVANVFETPTRATDVRGVVVSGSYSDTQTFPAAGDAKKSVEDVARGTVTLYNELSSAQQLVATTRLLSESGVLFRLDDAVTVPAEGSVEASVYADVPGVSGDIGPAKFTIPGLSAARQTSVYAQSTTAFSGGVREVAVVSQVEMNASAALMEASLLATAKESLITQVGETFSGASYDVAITDKTFSIEPDSEADQYDVVITIKVTAVYYDEDALTKIAVAKLYEGLGQGQEFADFDPTDMSTKVEGVDEEAGQANILVSLSVPAMTSRTSEALKVDRFVGLSETEVRDMLIKEGIATDVSVEFFPFWVSTVPRLKDHIYIDIK